MILVIDQGTTSTRAIVFGPDAEPVAIAQEEFPQIFPRPGWVEHDPEALWRDNARRQRAQALASAGASRARSPALGIANQRETTLVWEPRDRPADPQRDRLAGPAHGATLAPS